MKAPERARLALIVVALGLLTACGVLRQAQDDTRPPIGGAGALPQSRAVATHNVRGGSWMLPEAKGRSLLYVGLSGDGVDVYTYPRGRLVGSLGAFGAFLGSE